jgi:anti-sigma B factor antagonist
LSLSIAANGTAHGVGPRSPTVLAVAGEIDLATAPELRRALSEVLADGSNEVTVDLSAVVFIDATGIGALVAAAHQAQGAGRRLSLRAPSHQVRRILEVIDLEDELPIDG